MVCLEWVLPKGTNFRNKNRSFPGKQKGIPKVGSTKRYTFWKYSRACFGKRYVLKGCYLRVQILETKKVSPESKKGYPQQDLPKGTHLGNALELVQVKRLVS